MTGLRHVGPGMLALCAGLAAQTPEFSDAELALVRRIDDAFGRGDRAAFFACFAPDAPTHAMDAWRARWETLAPDSTPLVRVSVPTGRRDDGATRGMLVQVTYRDRRDGALPACAVTERWILAGDPAAPRLRLCVEHDADFDRRLRASGGAWTCPPCAFRMRTPSGWIAVPARAQSAPCMDAATFYHPTHDLALELGVQVVASFADARAVLRGVLAGEGRQRAADAALGWCPPQFGPDQRPAWIDGARVIYEIDAQRAVDLRAVAFGRLAFVLALYGPRPAHSEHAAAIERAFAGFQLDVAVTPEQLLARALQHHGGGAKFDAEGAFVHEGFGLRVPLATGWRRELQPGRDLAGAVAWHPQTRSRIRVTLLPPPRGFQSWSTILADRRLARSAGPWLAAAEDGGWTSAADRLPRRVLRGKTAQGPCGVCAIQRADLLVVVQWEACTDACRASVDRLLDAIEFR